MKKINSILKLAGLAACLLAAAHGALQAGAPLKINFQGRLDESGAPAEGSKSFVFKIYDVSSGGTPVWTSAAQSLALSQGVFSASLAAGSPAALSTGTFTGARYVEIAVDGVTLSPRQEMVSAPYALVAQALAPDAVIPQSTILAASVTDYHVLLTTGAITSGKFTDDRVYISTGAFYGGFNGNSQLVQLASDGKLPVLDGSALTGVAPLGANAKINTDYIAGTIVSTHIADASIGTADLASAVFNLGNFTAGMLSTDYLAGTIVSTHIAASGISAAKITSDTLNDSRLSANVTVQGNTFNGSSQLVKLDASGRQPALNVAGAVFLPIKTITSVSVDLLTDNVPTPSVKYYSVTENDYTVIVDGSGVAENIEVRLPAAASVSGRICVVKRTDGELTTVSVISDTGVGESIDGNASYDLNQGDSVMLQSDGANWFFLSIS